MTDSSEDHDKSMRLGAEDRKWLNIGRIFGGRTIERSDNAVCGLHCARGDKERMLLS
jgi:hypothetical protein